MNIRFTLIRANMRVILPSNSSVENYPNNTLTKFTVQLPQALDLSRGAWECGLSEIQFYKSWYNVIGGKYEVKRGNNIYELYIRDGYYETEEQFVNEVNEYTRTHLKEAMRECFSFGYDRLTKSCYLEVRVEAQRDLSFKFNETMTRVLGFEKLNIDEELAKVKKKLAQSQTYTIKLTNRQPMRLNSIFNLMVYSDIAQSSVIGDVEAPLLRVVPIEHGHWRNQCTTFTRIQYLPISQKQIRSITVYIFTDYGTPVPFNDGKTIVTLDFRKVKPLYTF